MFVWTALTVSAVILGAGWCGVPMAYDVETQVIGMDVKHDTGFTVKRVRSTKFPFFKVSTAFAEDSSPESPPFSPSPSKQSQTHNPLSNGDTGRKDSL